LKSLQSDLKNIGNDIQAKINQAGDEAKKTWNKLNSEREQFQEKAAEAAEETRADLKQMGADLKRRFESLRKDLQSKDKKQTSSSAQS
jgi:gas vesicle protein